jgi:hypothetical protein
MNLDSILPFAAFLEGRTLIAIIIPVVAIALGGVIAVCGMYFHHQQKKMLHDTARLALERGQPIPPELVSELSDTAHHSSAQRTHPRNDIRSGVILIAVGVGLYLFFETMSLHNLRFVGAIPGFIGVALLLLGIFDSLFARKKSAPDGSVQP